MTRFRILVPEKEEKIIEENSYMNKEKSILSYTIQPTGNCQLGCHYCGQTHSKAKMTEYVVEKSFNRIKKLY